MVSSTFDVPFTSTRSFVVSSIHTYFAKRLDSWLRIKKLAHGAFHLKATLHDTKCFGTLMVLVLGAITQLMFSVLLIDLFGQLFGLPDSFVEFEHDIITKG